MSGRDDQNDEKEKITVLFPDAEDEESQAEEEGLSEESDTDTSQPEADVVRVDFGGEKRRSLQEVVEEAKKSQSGLETAKYRVFERMVEQGMVMVTLDTRMAGVVVPDQFEGLPELRLNFSHLFQIEDFDYDERGVRASLSFEGVRRFCDVPWEAVFMLYSHETGDVVVFDPEKLP